MLQRTKKISGQNSSYVWKNCTLYLEIRIGYVKKTVFATNFTTTNWVKPAQPGESMFLILTLLVGALRALQYKRKFDLVSASMMRSAHRLLKKSHSISHYSNVMLTCEFAFNQKKLAVET